ncbi:hypothetical protein F4560_006753 [Saccharothrix ecbatanensis]|uniref:SMODS-associated and fused to various effectors domain-containing protein n=1 Tax=Saccharothrix ecbatanensis TaxID=1105145 RepID=A0A7W9HR92_9PSEU|nr:SAVED domain-containing protein [Saccharothrix ecbatanensis]MBB5806985.1 hypothetical protein [Saccharothrix ecbatanensis]
MSAELAHNVGATDGETSPRSESATPELDRESEENLLLVCHDCHRVIDDKDHIKFFPEEKLRDLKKTHERRIEMATASGGLTRTAVVRVGANIRGNYSIASRKEVAETLFALNYLGLVESQWSGDFTCQIQGHVGGKGYWDSAEQRIDDTLGRVRQAVEQGDVEHISVFPFAPIPLLVYLGSELDDKTTTKIFQKHRGPDAGWSWNATSSPVDFQSEVLFEDREAKEVVLVCELSSPVEPGNIPSEISRLPRHVLRPVGETPSPVLMASEQTFNNFAIRWRTLLAETEKKHPLAERWHLISSAPLSAAVEIGRSFMRNSQPPVAVYERMDTGYELALEVNRRGARK